MRQWIGIAAGLGIVAASGAPGAASAATCTQLEAWAGKLSNQQIWELNRIDRRVRLFEIFRGAEFESLFGKPALALSDGEVKAAGDTLGACALEARKARRNGEARSLAGAQSEFARRLQPLLVRVRDAQSKLEPALAALVALAPSPPLMRSLDVLRQAGTEADLRPGTGIPEGRQLVTMLASLPQETAVQIQPRLVQLYAQVREAVLAQTRTALAEAPATLAGLGAVDKTVQQIKYELGPALGADDAGAIEQAAASRREVIGGILVAEAGAALQEVPSTLEGARRLPQTMQRVKYELGRVIPADAMAGLDAVAERRRVAIEEALVAEAKTAIDAGPGGLPGIAPLQQVYRLPVMGALSQAGQDTVTAYGQARRARLVADAVAEVGKQPATTDGLVGLVGLAEMQRNPNLGYLAQDERNAYAQALARRRAEIAAGLLAPAIAKLDKFGKSLAELRAMSAFRNETLAPLAQYLGPRELEPFENAYQKNRARVAATALPEFQKNLAKVPEDDKGIAQVRTALREVGGGLPEFEQAAHKRTRELQQKLAAAMVQQICGEALTEAKVSKGDAKTAMLGLGGRIMTVGDFVCRLKVAEQKLNAYESPSLFGSEHQLKLTNRQGTYLTYTLREAEVAPGKKALVAFKVADASTEKALSVEEWQGHLAMLMPFDDANPPSDAACDAQFDKPDSKLTPYDQAQMFSCLFSRAQPSK